MSTPFEGVDGPGDLGVIPEVSINLRLVEHRGENLGVLEDQNGKLSRVIFQFKEDVTPKEVSAYQDAALNYIQERLGVSWDLAVSLMNMWSAQKAALNAPASDTKKGTDVLINRGSIPKTMTPGDLLSTVLSRWHCQWVGLGYFELGIGTTKPIIGPKGESFDVQVNLGVVSHFRLHHGEDADAELIVALLESVQLELIQRGYTPEPFAEIVKSIQA